MKKSILVLLCLFITLIGIQAQEKPDNVNIQWSPEMKWNPQINTFDMIAGDDGEVFTISYKEKATSYDYLIETYDTELKKTITEKLNLKHNGKKLRYYFTAYSNKKLYLFTIQKDVEAKQKNLFFQEIDTKTLKPKGEQKQLVSTKRLSKKQEGKFSYSFSDDKSKIAIFASDGTTEDGKTNDFMAFVFDKDMNLLWEKDITLDYQDYKTYMYRFFRVDNDGNIYVQGLLFAKTEEKENRDYSSILHIYKNQGETQREYEISLGDYFIKKIVFEVNEQNEIVCTGFYSEEYGYTTKGIFLIRIDQETGEEKFRKITELGEDLLKVILSKKELKKGAKEIYKYNIIKTIHQDDGSILLVAEQYEAKTVRSADFKTGTSGNKATYYFYNDIIVINISVEGDIEWVSKIPKTQATPKEETSLSSFIFLFRDDDLHFIFNDHIKNIKNPGAEELNGVFSYKLSALALVVMGNKYGDAKEHMLFESKEHKIMMHPKVSTTNSKGEVIIYGNFKNKYQLVKISFN